MPLTGKFTTVNPATGADGPAYDGHTPEEAAAILGKVHGAWSAYRRTSLDQRADWLRRAAAVLRGRREAFAGLMTAEMGKTLADGRAEIEKCAGHCEWFADNGPGLLAREAVDIGGPKAFVTFNPLGVVLAVMPWNFPFWQAIRFAAPALMAGNAAVLKHASNVPGCALAIEQVFAEAGFPQDVFRTVLIGGAEVEPLIADPRVAAVTLTGSVAAGRAVAAAAGAALKKCVLELGGSDAYLVLEDADIAAAARVAAAARMTNGGQSCVAGKRFVVVEPVAQAFEAALVEAMSAYVPGDPELEETRVGPLVSKKARDEVHAQVQASIAAGARLLLGGAVPDRPGAWYPPTVLADVRPGQPAHDDEIFGPVAAVIRARDEADAIRIANDSEFGLGSGVLTGDRSRGERIAAEDLEAGMAFVNANVASNSRLPFGGVKHSGYGRECARYGMLEFCNIKTVVIADLPTAHPAAD
ncbi:MAG: NAD-dependent succinate-semialdehyde dehydrogenase [Caulobacteraceae bacterium]|nr:NAD-dependent succinate-semialdehyde dehydrogenase [Caulobacteraceae bacterium]